MTTKPDIYKLVASLTTEFVMLTVESLKFSNVTLNIEALNWSNIPVDDLK